MDQSIPGGAAASNPAVTPQQVPQVEVLGERALATLLDTVVLFFIALAVLVGQWIVSLLFFWAPEGVQLTVGILGLISILAIPVFFVAYYVYFEGRKGQTLGKMVLGIKVIREDTGGTPGIEAALIRTLLRVVDGFFIYLVGLLIASGSEKKQRLGDQVGPPRLAPHAAGLLCAPRGTKIPSSGPAPPSRQAGEPPR